MAGYYFDILETITDPEAIYEGKYGTLIAVRKFEMDKHLIAVYKEISHADGFIITAFLTKRIKQIERRIKLWPM